MKRQHLLNISFLLAVFGFGVGCAEKEYAIPEAKTEFQNDCIKRNLGPNVIGTSMEFAYAMALPASQGTIVSAQVEASIAGAPGTYMDNKSYYTNGSGIDVGIPVGSTSNTEGTVTKVNFNGDTSAATLRYFYVVPEAARGQQVTFTFSANSSNGETVNYTMGPYTVSNMDMVLDLAVEDGAECYISIADMAVYTAADAAANADRIDLVYLYRVVPNITFAHALVSPAADPVYRPGVTLPAGVDKSTKILKAWNIRDQQLARLQFGVFVDDLDFQQLDLTEAPNYAINMRAESGAWVETADGRYRAYIFINKLFNSSKSAQISIKRYAL